MAANAWAVTTEQLTTTSTNIKDETVKFKTAYEQLATEVQGLKSSAWQGTASDTFNSKIDQYQATFQQLETVLNQFADALATKASNYEKTETAIADAAGSL